LKVLDVVRNEREIVSQRNGGNEEINRAD